jgi:hypothetical protein
MAAMNSNCENVAERAKAIIASDPYFRGTSYPLKFESFENVLVVRGCVPSYYLKQIIQRTLCSMEGVDRIVNQVEVDYGRLGS